MKLAPVPVHTVNIPFGADTGMLKGINVGEVVEAETAKLAIIGALALLPAYTCKVAATVPFDTS